MRAAPCREDLIGRRFGQWVVLDRAPSDRSLLRRWSCRCDCGRFAVVYQGALLAGASRSCGCLRFKKPPRFGADPSLMAGAASALFSPRPLAEVVAMVRATNRRRPGLGSMS